MLHTAFYKFAALPDPQAAAARVRELAAPLLGSVLLAHEGISGALAGPAAALDAFEHALQHDARFDGRFHGIVFKRSACLTPPFARLKVHVKQEIVALGLPGTTAGGCSSASPAQWRSLLDDPHTVVLDNRNSFEYRLGRFRGAIDPRVANFRDFPAWVAEQAPQWKAQGRRIAMYCTGGIRCEKTGAWMHEAHGLDVVQLDGGILNFLQSMPDAQRDWQGECFVFDNRIALDAALQETGTTAEQVYAGFPGEAWRLERAKRLDTAA
ncbi:MAG: hypothetical protein EPO01_09295 [Aquabacterium sp.]|nr:MAG: hypothetical protein EPO01_09295 [Aquabacterium sp.]